MKIKFSLILLLAQFVLLAQPSNEHLKQGNKLYEDKNYDEAEIKYRMSIADEKKDASSAEFNLGDALYKQERFEEATEQFKKVADQTENKELKSKALHNLGNSLSKEEKYKEAAEAYKESLKLNPKDNETRYNLTRTMRQLKQQQQQQQQDQKQDENGDEKKQEDQQNQDPKDDENQQDKEGGQPDKPDDGEEKKESKPKPNKISREDAERLLKALDKEEQEVQKKVNEYKVKGTPVTTEKDW